MLKNILLALLVGVIAWLVCIFVGGGMVLLEAPIAVYVGDFLRHYAVVISVLAALWFFFTGGGSNWTIPWRKPPTS